MHVDLFRRLEANGRFSYLAVPQGACIPDEAVSTDWQLATPDIELLRTDVRQTGLAADDAERQMAEKGYAISPNKLTDGAAEEIAVGT